MSNSRDMRERGQQTDYDTSCSGLHVWLTFSCFRKFIYKYTLISSKMRTEISAFPPHWKVKSLSLLLMSWSRFHIFLQGHFTWVERRRGGGKLQRARCVSVLTWFALHSWVRSPTAPSRTWCTSPSIRCPTVYASPSYQTDPAGWERREEGHMEHPHTCPVSDTVL